MSLNRRLWASLVAVVLLSVTIAGCVGEKADPDPDPEGVPQKRGECEGEPRTTDETGAVDGRVSSDLFEPLGGTRLILWDERRTEQLEEVRSTQEGEFVFCELEPARYAVQALHDGYETSVRGVDVKQGSVATVHLELAPLPTTDPYVIEEDIEGLLEFGYRWHVEVPGQGCTHIEGVPTCGTDIQYNSQNWRGSFEIDNETKSIVMELDWDSAGPLGEYLWFDLYCDEVHHVNPTSTGDFGQISDPDHPCYFAPQRQTSPVVHRVDEAHWSEHGYDHLNWSWRVYPGYGTLGTHGALGVDVGLGYSQAYTIYLSVFQREGAPEAFTRLPDA